MSTEFSVDQNKNPQNIEQTQVDPLDRARDYIDTLRQHYLDGDIAYAGRRNEDQQAVVELVSEQAREMVDGVAAGFLAVGATIGRNPDGPQTTHEIIAQHQSEELAGGLTWQDYREAFSSLLSSMAVMSQRLKDRDFPVTNYMDLSEEEQLNVASVLFNDFQEHNALRFGVDTAGLTETKRSTKHNLDEGTVDTVITVVDPDKAENWNEVEQNMNRRQYKAEKAQHQAGKISPAKYRELRQEYKDVDKDTFDHVISHNKRAEEALRRHHETGEDLVGAAIATQVAKRDS